MSRMTRFATLLPTDLLQGNEITIIGVGSIGRQVALQLASMGVKNISLYDHDEVSSVNMGTQGYRPDQIKKNKAEATADDLRLILSDEKDIMINPFAKKYEPGDDIPNIIFCCVDTMAARGAIYDYAGKFTHFFCDARMAAEACHIFTTVRDEDWYTKSLFDDKDAFPARCTEKSTIYCATFAASLMVGQYTKWLRNFRFEREILYSLLATDLMVSEPHIKKD